MSKRVLFNVRNLNLAHHCYSTDSRACLRPAFARCYRLLLIIVYQGARQLVMQKKFSPGVLLSAVSCPFCRFWGGCPSVRGLPTFPTPGLFLLPLGRPRPRLIGGADESMHAL